MYKTKAGARNGIKAVQSNASNTSRYDRRKDKRGQNYFVLKAGKHQIIGTSESYSSAAAMEKGIKSVMKNGVVETVSDKT